MHLHHIVIDDGDVTDVQDITIQETMKGMGIMKGLNLGLVEALSKFAPHGVEHEFSEGTQPRVVFNLVVLQLDAFMQEILFDVNLFFLFRHLILRPPTGFLFDF